MSYESFMYWLSNAFINILSYSHLFLNNLGSWHKVYWSAFEIWWIFWVKEDAFVNLMLLYAWFYDLDIAITPISWGELVVIGRAKQVPHWAVQSRFHEIYVGMHVCMSVCLQKVRMSKCVVGITWPKHAHTQRQFWAVKTDMWHPYSTIR